MSAAVKCDACGNLFEASLGCATIGNIYVATKINADGESSGTSWSDVDLCPGCARPVLELLKPALIGLKLPRLKK